MRSAVHALAIGLAALVAVPARAGTILYATAASQQRVDGFCVLGNGGLAPTPAVSRATAGIEPRRLLVAGGILYVAELNQVQAFAIGPHGALQNMCNAGTRRNQGCSTDNNDPATGCPGATCPKCCVGFGTEVLTKKQTGNNMEAVDLTTSPDGNLLYVAERGPDQVVAYAIPLGSEAPLTSCVQGQSNADYLALAVHAGMLYAAAAGAIRGVEVFVLNPDGSLPAPPGNCIRSGPKQTRSAPTVPLSCRKRLERPRGMVIDETSNILYVEDKVQSRILAFALQPDGTFSPAPLNCTQSSQKKKEQQKPLNKTEVVAAYQSLLLTRSTLFGIQFEHGRIDAYRVQSDGKVSLKPTLDFADVRMTPVRGAINGNVLYLGGGELDGVRAFRLRDSDGMLAQTDFFSQTDSQSGSFPNDVALATVDSCP